MSLPIRRKMMEIKNELPYQGGRVFRAITKGDHLEYIDGLTLQEYTKLADKNHENLYWCCQYPSGTLCEIVYYGTFKDEG